MLVYAYTLCSREPASGGDTEIELQLQLDTEKEEKTLLQKKLEKIQVSTYQ